MAKSITNDAAHPERLKIIWEILVTLCAGFLALFIPLNLLFNLDKNGFYLKINLIVTTVLLLDLFWSIFKGNYKRYKNSIGEEIRLSSYIKRWFIIDLISVLPFGVFFPGSILQLLRMTKLIKVAHYMKLWKQSSVRYSNILTLLFFAFWVSHSAHWISCGWLLLRGIDHSINIFTNYIHSLYWCITTLSTVGYGDITPVNNAQMIYAIFVMALGVGIYGYIIGKIAGILSKKDPSKANYIANLEKLTALVQIRNIPFELQERIRNYYTYMYNKRMGYDESSFLQGLPDTLRQEVSLHLKKESVEMIPIFQNAGEDFIKDIALHLKPVVFTPGDFIFKEGEMGNEMFFVVQGELKVMNNNRTITTFTGGDFFGEISLFKNITRTASVQALSYSDLYSLSKEVFQRIVSKYPNVAKEIIEKAQSRLQNDNLT